MKTNIRKLLISSLLMISMLLSLFVVTPLKASAATINAVWWTDSSNQTDFTASFDSEWISSKDWHILMKYDETLGIYAQVSGSSGYVGTKTQLDFEEAIRRSGNGKYKVAIETTSGVEYETAEKTYTFAGALDAPKNLRWDGEIVRWGAVDGADIYDVCLYFKKEGEVNFRPWSSARIQRSKTSYDFAGQLSNPGTYYFTVDAISNDKTLTISSSKSPEKTVSYTYSDLNAHFGDINNDEKKYTLYWDESPDATGYYMVFSKKNGETYQPVTGVDNKLSKVTRLDLYAVMEANGEGDYKAEFFAFNTSPTIPVSNDASVEITFTICEHSYTKKIETSDYLHSESISCTSITEYYYACEHCGEAAPNEEQYIYEGAIGEHDLSAGYQADGKMHWLACAKCDYAEYQKHTLDANNYCAKCDTTVYNVWLGDIRITSKNCDDITGDGSAFYIPEQNRLFLTNYTDPNTRRVGTTITEPDTGDEYVAMIYAENGLNLYLRGENFLQEDEEWGMQCAVYVKAGDLTVTGEGSLDVFSTRGFYVEDGDIYLDLSGSIEIYSGYVFKHVDHNIYINNGTVIGHSYNGDIFSQVPVLDDYRCYYAVVSENYDMSNAVPYDPSNSYAKVRYFRIDHACMVTIEPFECEGDNITEVLIYGTEYTLSECPYTAPEGKTFYKWGITPPGIMKEAGEKITVTEDVELIPLWQVVKATSITATYSGTILAGNKIDPANISITLNYNDSSTQPVNAGDVEYWYGDVQITDPKNYVFGTDLIGDVNITIKYAGLETTMTVKIVGHEITFNANGGTGEMAKAEYVGEYTLPNCTFSAPTGKQFKGWATSADGDIIAATIYNVNENVELFAIWEDVAKTSITSISVSGADLPEVGKTANDMMFTPDTLTYGGEYKMVGRGFQKFNGTEWVDYNSDGDIIEYGIKYRVSLVLAPNDGYAFADTITSDDVTFNGKAGVFDTLIASVGYVAIYYEFSYEAPATDYGITIADKDESGATVGVLITEENYTDVLGDGTVSYDPTTNTLTLNGYKYEGSGFGSTYSKYVIYVPNSIGELNIVLEGENRIVLSTDPDMVWACAIFIPKTDVIIKGNGSLVINSSVVGFSNINEDSDSRLEIKGGNITINAFNSIGVKYFKISGGSLVINAIGEDVPGAIYCYEFNMTGGSLKIASDGLGIEMWHDSDEDTPPTISGGTFEVSTEIAGGAFCYYIYDEDKCVAIAPDLTNYVGTYKMIAGTNADGTSAVDYSASDIATYKYTKLEFAHVHDYDTTWKSDESNHWNECECGDKANIAAHKDENNDGKCDICDYEVGNSNNPGGNTELKKKGLSAGAVAGIVAGSVALAGLGGSSIVWFVIKKKKSADLFKK